MTQEKYILAVDLGTSGPKVALFTTEGRFIGHTVGDISIHLLPGGGAEQDPDDWWRSIRKGIHDLLAQELVAVNDIVALSCTSQWSGTVAVGRDGRPLMNAIIWMDSRGAPETQTMNRGVLNIEGYGVTKALKWMRLTGGAPSHAGKDSISHILYIKHHHPQVYEETFKFLEPKDYLNLVLTGRFAATYDSITLHWVTDNRDLGRVVYDDGLLSLAGIEREKMPELVRAVDVLGTIQPEVARDLGLPEEIQVIGGTPDVHSAAIGSGAVADFEPHLYLGTSSWLICHVPFKKTDIFHNMASLPSAIPNRYLLINEQECAGGCLSYLLDNILYPVDELSMQARPSDAYARLDALAASAPAGSDGLIFTPWLYGERTPVDDHTVRGGFFNQSLRTTRAHMVRAVYEGVAFNSKWLLKYVEKFVNRTLPDIRVIGGGARSHLWCQIMADVLDRNIHLVAEPLQANTRGAALLASVALGYLELDEISSHVEITDTFTPDPDHRAIYDQLFAEFIRIYEQNRRIYARLNH